MGSEDYATSNPNPNSEDGSSLAARRARLRGTLAKQATPPDPYKPDPYLLAPSSDDNGSTSGTSSDPQAQAATVSADASASTAAEPSQAPANTSTSAVDLSEISIPTNGSSASESQTAEVPSFFNAPASTDFSSLAGAAAAIEADFETVLPAPAPASEPTFAVEQQPEIEPAPPIAAESPSMFGSAAGGNGGGSHAPTLSSASFFASTTSSEQSNRNEEKASFFSEPEVESVPETETETVSQQPAPRSDRRKHAGVPAASPISAPAPEPDQSASTAAADVSQQSTAVSTEPPAATPLPPDPVADRSFSMTTNSGGYVYGIQPDGIQSPSPIPQAIEIMNNIDQAMGACAMNLSELQKIATEQTDALKGVAESLQNQSFFEIGLNLNSLMESLSAALEPMKAVGELVPAIDQLVAVMESRESGGGHEEPTKLSREQLITSLAEQLSSGQIDPWTFKCAYMAVFPAEHPADLLHRLVDLLGTQRLSGDLFRSAYDAVQAPDPPPRTGMHTTSTSEDGETRTIVKMVQDETILAQLDDLKRSNEEFSKKHEEIQKKLEQKDQEFGQVLATKEQELQEAQELLNSRWEEFNARYDELTETLHKRDEVLQEREAELAKKESENNQLRTQMEELRDQTKEMVADLQRQLSAKPKEETPKQPGFFDVAPGAQQNPQQQQQPQQGQLFDAGPARPLFGQTEQQAQQTANPLDQLQPQSQQLVPQAAAQMQPQMQPQLQQQQPLQQPMAPPRPVEPQSAQAVPRPAAPTTPFVSGAGSYGSGVRAQVFEVIVRQALAGAPWREICAGPMQVNNISPEEVETEVKRRQALLKK